MSTLFAFGDVSSPFLLSSTLNFLMPVRVDLPLLFFSLPCGFDISGDSNNRSKRWKHAIKT